MKLKVLGKRILYLVGGILLTFICSIILAVYLDDGGQWISQSTFYLAIGILTGLGLIIDCFARQTPKQLPPQAPKQDEIVAEEKSETVS